METCYRQSAMAKNWAYRIALAKEDDVTDGIRTAPHYGAKTASAIKRTISIIHGVEDLHRYAVLEDIEVYLGRCSGTPTHLMSRWKSHHRTRKHQYATVLFKCDHGKAQRLEALAIQILSRLENRNELCVGSANIQRSGAGGPPTGDFSIIYMTWATRDVVVSKFRKPGIATIRRISHGLAPDFVDIAKRAQIERGLSSLKRIRVDRAKLLFYPD